MDASDQCSFYVDGFSDKRWPVDIYIDLAVFLEQISNALSSLHDVKEFEIDFYEQGIERLLSFTPILTERTKDSKPSLQIRREQKLICTIS